MSNSKHRPPRLERVFVHLHPFYFITFNTYGRRPLLAHEDIHACFIQFATKARAHGVAVGRYVVMPDHVHLFVQLPPSGSTLPQWVKSLRSVLGKQLLRLGHDKPHWQEGFFDHLMRSRDSYSEKWDYVRMNPVRARLVDHPEAWPYQGEIDLIKF